MFVILPVFALYARDAPRRRDPHADRLRARRLRPHAGRAADPVRLGVRQMGAQARDLQRPLRLRGRQLRRRVGARASAGSSSAAACRARAPSPRRSSRSRPTSRATSCARARWPSSASPSRATFAASLIVGPVLKGWIGVPGIFALTGVLALAAMAVVRFAVPDPRAPRASARPTPGQLARVAARPAAPAPQLRHVRAARGADGAVHAGAVRAARQRPRRRAALDRVPAGARRVGRS